MAYGGRIAPASYIMQGQKLFTLRWRSFLGYSNDIVTTIFASEGGR